MVKGSIIIVKYTEYCMCICLTEQAFRFDTWPLHREGRIHLFIITLVDDGAVFWGSHFVFTHLQLLL